MKFKHGTRRRALEYEKYWVDKWKEDKTFEKSVEQRSKDNRYVFYDGPPFISGNPHHGTLLSSIVKDAIPRYQTMKGKRVERVWGWDCHGLPAERFTEKKLGIHSRQEVIEYGIEKYINATRENMLQTSSEWEDVVDRIGRWVDFKGAYKTMDKDYMESIWWAFKTLYEKGKIYEGEKVLMYCTLDGTPLSKAEVTMDAGAYQDVTDPSVYVRFKLENYSRGAYTSGSDGVQGSDEKQTEPYSGTEKGVSQSVTQQSAEVSSDASSGSVQDDGPVYMLAWTTTPWTLPANTALAVNKDVTYVEVEYNNEMYVVAKDLLEKVFTDEKHNALDYSIKREFEGEELVGLTYEPLFENRGEHAHKIWHANYVETEAGTGIVHLAPIYGEEDFELSKKEGFPSVHVIDQNGIFTEGPWQGHNVWEINKTIAKEMHRASASDEMQGSSEQRSEASRDDGDASSAGDNTAVRREEAQQVSGSDTEQAEPWRGSVWKIDYIRHSYPHCHRCGTKLMYRAHPSWFMDIDSQRTEMLEKNEPIYWFPEHVKHGRFENTIKQAPDWNISRDRFWATAMPVWKGEDNNGVVYTKVVGSYKELKELSGVELEDYHRPWIDDVTFTIDGITYKRIDKVMDSWFEAGSMPFAQFHYPFENKQKFEQNFPGDFIVEYIGQVRAWFYYMHAMNVALFGENSFKNVIVTGNVAGNDGRKMSKSYGNYTDPNELMDKFSADSLRFLLLSSPLLKGEDFALQDKEVGDIARKLSMIWNMYDFFTMYAEVDGWEFSGELKDPIEEATNPLDIWILSRLHQLVKEVEHHMDSYNIPDAMNPILTFIDDASNWYVRRSRRRFWKSDDDSDKAMAYKTLHYTLTRLSYVLAPFTPFMAEELHSKMTGDNVSVHLKDWLSAGPINEIVMNDMDEVRDTVKEGLRIRAQNQIRVRQPLKSVTVKHTSEHFNVVEILTEELNVKEVLTGDEISIDVNITPELELEGIAREVVRHIQAARKKAGLQVGDRIKLSLSSDSKSVLSAIETHRQYIADETLTSAWAEKSEPLEHKENTKVGKHQITISLQKSGN